MYNVSFSGGLGSAVSALTALEQGLEFRLIFADTLIEDDDLYRFNAEVAKACGVEFIHLIEGRTPWDVYEDRRWIGNTRTAHCSTELKTVPVMNWLARNAKESEPLVLGMDWSEQDRIDRARRVWQPRPVVSLLNKFRVSRADYADVLQRHGIEPPRLYAYGFEHNNCGGFCCKAGLKQFARLREAFPERYDYHARRMEQAMAKIGDTAKPFLRKNINQKREYLTLNQYAALLDRQAIDVPEFDASGCGCFTDEVPHADA